MTPVGVVLVDTPILPASNISWPRRHGLMTEDREWANDKSRHNLTKSEPNNSIMSEDWSSSDKENSDGKQPRNK